LAEDNETNREVMQEQLRLLGYTSEMAEDGLVALEMWRSGRYALLLTDCHMPNMDGFELTASIRQDERMQARSRRAPIIAVTANAMQGEAERCRERGMDDYLSKPLRLNELGPMLAKWMPMPVAEGEAVAGGAADAVPPASTEQESVWDSGVLTRMVGNNPPMHRRLLEKFLVSARDQVERIGTASANEDAETAGRVAHALKSAARTVGALQLGSLCEQLEQTAREDESAQWQTLADQASPAFSVVAECIAKHLESQA
jgi:CheY-like chemotaxis protein